MKVACLVAIAGIVFFMFVGVYADENNPDAGAPRFMLVMAFLCWFAAPVIWMCERWKNTK